jgi:hypothetical protein
MTSRRDGWPIPWVNQMQDEVLSLFGNVRDFGLNESCYNISYTARNADMSMRQQL